MKLTTVVKHPLRRRVRRLLMVKATVTIGVLAVIFMPHSGEFVAVATNMMWIWVDP